MENIVSLYGTDHLYYDTPYAESLGADDFDKALDIRINAAKNDCRIFKEVDPEATWFSDSWDFRTLTSFWTPERKEKYFSAVPRDMMIMGDATTDFELHYAENNYYHGLPWTVGVLHSFQGDDHLHGNLQGLIDIIKNAANDPKSNKLMGYVELPEIHGANTLYWQLSTELAWNPKDVKLDDFLKSYTRGRYGDESFAKMLEAQKCMVKGVYQGNGRIPIYKKVGIAVAYTSEIWDDSTPGNITGLTDTIRSLRKALDLAMPQREAQKNNPLYENDMVEWTKSYLGHLFNYYTIRSYQAFKAGNAKELERCRRSSLLCLDEIEKILSTRPDYQLKNTIDQAMSVPGTNPFTPKMIRQSCVNWLYATNDCYEQMKLYYRPKMEVYFDALKERVKNDQRALGWGDVADQCGKIQEKWLNNSSDVPVSEHFHGTTMEAVARALLDTREIASSCGTEKGWRTGEALSIQCAAKLISKGLSVVSLTDGPAKTTEQKGSTCWTFGTRTAEAQPYLFFAVNDILAYDCSGPATITVEYLDEGQGNVTLEYDSTDPKAPYGGAVKPVPAFSLTGMGGWKTARITVPDARFASRLNSGSDFRLLGDGVIMVRKITVRQGVLPRMD